MSNKTEEDERDTFTRLGETEVVRSLALARERRRGTKKAAERNARTPVRRLFDDKDCWLWWRGDGFSQ